MNFRIKKKLGILKMAGNDWMSTCMPLGLWLLSGPVTPSAIRMLSVNLNKNENPNLSACCPIASAAGRGGLLRQGCGSCKVKEINHLSLKGTTKLNSIFDNIIQVKIQQDLCSYKMQQNILPNCPKLGTLDLGQHCNNVSKDALKILPN